MNMSSFADLLGLDARAVALFRFVLGMLIVADSGLMVLWWGDAAAFYADDQGLLPRSILVEKDHQSVSLLFISGSSEFACFIVGLNTISAFTFGIGFCTWTSNLVCLVTLYSMHARCWQEMHSFDHLFRLCLVGTWRYLLVPFSVWIASFTATIAF